MESPWYVTEAFNYRKDRYMSHLSDDDLFKRAKEVFGNCTIINGEGKIEPDMSNDYGQYFLIRWTHIIEEYRLRFKDVREVFHEHHLAEFNISKKIPLIDKACLKIKGNSLDNSKVILYKYGKREHLEKYLTEGRIRISPASFYSDASLNHAINDDELNFTAQNPPSRFRMEVFDKVGNFKGKIKPLEGKVTFQSTTNFYVYCASKILSPRLFVDFDSDSCIIIKNVPLFLKKFLGGFFEIKNGYYGSLGDVQYLDPIFTYYNDFDVFHSKHFRYAYQREFRICFIPFDNMNELNQIEIIVGNLEDCCELICVDD